MAVVITLSNHLIVHILRGEKLLTESFLFGFHGFHLLLGTFADLQIALLDDEVDKRDRKLCNMNSN